LADISGYGGGLSPRQEQAVAALLEHPTAAAAAAAVGVHEKTLRRWLKQTAFLNAYRSARRALVEAAVARVQQALGRGAETLVRNLTCGVPAAEIAAARQLFEQAYKGVELLDLAGRVATLEERAARGNQR
jgi:hypothetical protein